MTVAALTFAGGANKNNNHDLGTTVNNEITVVGDEIEAYKDPTPEQEYIQIPGLRKQYNLTKENKEIYLVNPAGNSVYLKYTLYIDGKQIYTTDHIKPDAMVKADLYSLLDAGTYDVKVAISSIDTETHAACNGAELSVEVTVTK